MHSVGTKKSEQIIYSTNKKDKTKQEFVNTKKCLHQRGQQSHLTKH